MDICVDCLIPAAGISSRMGQWKLLLPFHTSTIIEECISTALNFCSRVIVVTGYRAQELEIFLASSEKITNTLYDSNITKDFEGSSNKYNNQKSVEIAEKNKYFRLVTIRHNKYPQGMFSSIQKGVSKITSSQFFVIPGDMPQVPDTIYKELWKYKTEHPDIEIVRPTYKGLPGHPVLLDAACIKTILEMPYNSSMSKVLARHTVQNMAVSSFKVVLDFDNFQEYEEYTGSGPATCT